MIFLVAMMLMAASAEDAEWLPVTVEQKIPINFDNSKFEVRSDYLPGGSAGMIINFWGADDQKLVGWSVSMGNFNNGPGWNFDQCMLGRVEIPEGVLTEMTQVWTISKRDGKLTVLLDGETVIVEEAYPGDRDETKCSETDDDYGFPDWEKHWNTKTVSLSIGPSNINHDPTGYRIIQTGEDITESDETEEDRQRMSTATKISFNSWIMISSLICLPLLRYV